MYFNSKFLIDFYKKKLGAKPSSQRQKYFELGAFSQPVLNLSEY